MTVCDCNDFNLIFEVSSVDLLIRFGNRGENVQCDQYFKILISVFPNTLKVLM